MAQKTRFRVIKMFETRGGTASNGREWRLKELLVLTFGKWPKELFLTLTANRDITFAERSLVEGDVIQTEMRPFSRLWNGRYYTQVNTYGLMILTEDFKPKFKTERTADEEVNDEDYEERPF